MKKALAYFLAYIAGLALAMIFAINENLYGYLLVLPLMCIAAYRAVICAEGTAGR